TEVASGSPMTTMVITTGHYPTTHWRPMTSTTPAIYQTGTEQSRTDRLRHDMVAGHLVPHQRLVEADVAEEHQASRGDVRLALMNSLPRAWSSAFRIGAHASGRSHCKRLLK